jgi:DNA polymerase III subunit delta'
MEEYYPWQDAQWAQCQQRIRLGTLPHALLLSGRVGIGKHAFAHRLARRLLCDQPSESACGRCRGCHLFSVGNHPDYLGIAIEEDSQQLKIDQIRALNYFMGLSRKSSHHKIALISNPDQMNKNAANSLLKTLEEPPAFSLILLVTARRALLPATIISRCQQLAFSIPSHDVARAWLKRQAPAADADRLLALAAGAPLKALELSAGNWLEARQAVFKNVVHMVADIESPVTIAAHWQQFAPEPLLSWLLSGLTDIAKLRADSAFNRLNNPDVDQELRALAKRIDSQAVFTLYDTMLQHRRRQQGSHNPQLMIEHIVLAWKAAFKHSTFGYNDGGL